MLRCNAVLSTYRQKYGHRKKSNEMVSNLQIFTRESVQMTLGALSALK
jgi:hypothetical protein